MLIRLMPQRRDEELTLERRGERLVINGTVIDFSDLAEGVRWARADLGSPWLVDDVWRKDGVLQIMLYLPVGPNPGEAERFPRSIEVPMDGPVPLPSRIRQAAEENPDL